MLSAPAGWQADHFQLVERVWASAATPTSARPAAQSPAPSPPPPPPLAPYRPPPGLKNELFKTEMCRSYVATAGFCRYGGKCQFAHGAHELRPVRRHPRYKTKHCRNWATHGACPYGIRCRFIHAADPVAALSALSALSAPPPAYAHFPTYPAAPLAAPAAVAAAYDPDTHGPLSAFTRELLAELPPATAVPAPTSNIAATPPRARLSVFSELMEGSRVGGGGGGGGGGEWEATAYAQPGSAVSGTSPAAAEGGGGGSGGVGKVVSPSALLLGADLPAQRAISHGN